MHTNLYVPYAPVSTYHIHITCAVHELAFMSGVAALHLHAGEKAAKQETTGAPS